MRDFIDRWFAFLLLTLYALMMVLVGVWLQA